MNKTIYVAEDGTLYGEGVEEALAEVNKYFGKQLRKGAK